MASDPCRRSCTRSDPRRRDSKLCSLARSDLYLASAIEGSVREDQIIAGRLGSYGIEPVRRPEPENARIFEFCQRIQVIDIKTL